MKYKALYIAYIVFLLCFLLFFLEKILMHADAVSSRPAAVSECIIDSDLGWLPKPGKGTIKTSEFLADHSINENYMNDDPVNAEEDKNKIRIVALGDSHTYAVGVSTHESWPNVLEKNLNERLLGKFVVYNLAVSGYSVHQHYFRLMRDGFPLKPDMVIIGFSSATDLYDIVPPSHGGFTCQKNLGRLYFDLDGSTLTKKRYSTDNPENIARKNKIRDTLDFFSNFAIYRRIKGSTIAYIIAIMFSTENTSGFIWSGPATFLLKKIDDEAQYRWMLLEKILKKISDECRARDINCVLVNIPYLPQVYDNVWKWSFGLRPDLFDRNIGNVRIKFICEKNGITFIDTTEDLRNYVKQNKQWIHFRKNMHPTKKGHIIIANKVESGLHNILGMKEK